MWFWRHFVLNFNFFPFFFFGQNQNCPFFRPKYPRPFLSTLPMFFQFDPIFQNYHQNLEIENCCYVKFYERTPTWKISKQVCCLYDFRIDKNFSFLFLLSKTKNLNDDFFVKVTKLWWSLFRMKKTTKILV